MERILAHVYTNISHFCVFLGCNEKREKERKSVPKDLIFVILDYVGSYAFAALPQQSDPQPCKDSEARRFFIAPEAQAPKRRPLTEKAYHGSGMLLIIGAPTRTTTPNTSYFIRSQSFPIARHFSFHCAVNNDLPAIG